MEKKEQKTIPKTLNPRVRSYSKDIQLECVKLLKEGMEKFGFINYPFEYWHYSIGDVCAAYLGGQDTAVFGPVEFDSQSHNLTTPIKGKQLREFFNV